MPSFLETNIQFTPAIRRTSMAYQPVIQPAKAGLWKGTLILRRIIFSALILASTWAAAVMMTSVMSPQGLTPLKWAIITIFTILFGWISMSFWTSIIGFLIVFKRQDPFALSKQQQETPLAADTQIAIVMPIYHEEVARVFAGLRVMYESLQATSQGEQFHFFILSDSHQPSYWEKEEEAYQELCRQVDGAGKIFYRRRKIRIHKKSGNISDFCRRWGSQYKYMLPLDADSLMSGEGMVRMVKVMETREDIGILQTPPRGINQKSLISRISQFTSYLYGSLQLAGSYFVQLDNAGFWGHNAIIRMEPFMKYCALPKLAGSLPFGGEILSHDFIEAALMRRAGWGVWLAYGFEDSYEELPPSLLEELERDLRWCRGNIQHLRLVLMKGISLGHRQLFLNGNMFYFSALLWLSLLLLMTMYAIEDFFHKIQYFSNGHQLFPNWPVHERHLSMELLWMTAIFLFLPKILSIVWAVLDGQARLFGGTVRLFVSAAAETVFSILLAPIRMLFHSWFILKSLLGGTFDWTKQSRSLKKVSLAKGIKAHWLGSVLALTWGLIALVVNQNLFLWLSVIIIPLIFAVPLSIFVSHPKTGDFFRQCGFFLTPVETNPSAEIRRLQQLVP